MTLAARPRRAPHRRPGRLRRFFRSPRVFPRRITLTREGKFVVVITLGVGFAAINTGNNLLYLVLGMLLSLMVTSGVLSELTLRAVRAERLALDPLVAGEFGWVRVVLTNDKRWFASFSVEVSERIDDVPGLEQAPGYVLHLRPGERVVVRARLRASRRGVLASEGISLATRFPFSFFRKSRLVVEPVELIVHPHATRAALPAFPSRRQGQIERGRRVGTGGDIYGLRDFRPGDGARDVHWKSSARRRRLVAKELERPAARAVVVGLPTALPPEHDEERFEGSVSRAAGLALGLLERGYAVGLTTHAGGVGTDAGPGHGRRLLDYLARVELVAQRPRGPVPPLPWPRDLADRVLVSDGAATLQAPEAWAPVPPRGAAAAPRPPRDRTGGEAA